LRNCRFAASFEFFSLSFELGDYRFPGNLTIRSLESAVEFTYHLYVSLACPWAHRTLMVRALKGLEKVISVDVVHPYLRDGGWTFDTDFTGATGDSLGGHSHLRQVYQLALPDYTGIITVPVLWDKKLGAIVNNGSSEIIRMLNSEFQTFATHPELDLYPSALRGAIDDTNAWVYESINNGVYCSGFARNQRAHAEAVNELFDALERVQAILSKQAYLCGDVLTEADVRLFATLIRFDWVYHTHFSATES
jgi:glutathionyl-hydroquinone reductase